MKRIAQAIAPFSGAVAAVIFSAAVLAAAPARAQQPLLSQNDGPGALTGQPQA